VQTTVQELANQLKSSISEERKRAIISLGDQETDVALSLILHIVEDESNNVREAVCEALGTLARRMNEDNPSIVKTLQLYLRDSAPIVRIAAFRSSLSLKTQSTIDSAILSVKQEQNEFAASKMSEILNSYKDNKGVVKAIDVNFREQAYAKETEREKNESENRMRLARLKNEDILKMVEEYWGNRLDNDIGVDIWYKMKSMSYDPQAFKDSFGKLMNGFTKYYALDDAFREVLQRVIYSLEAREGDPFSLKIEPLTLT